MREVLKWSKNYRTGEEVSEKVLKPDNLIGQAKIEVRDSITGNLVQEVETHNVIVPSAKFLPNIYYENLYQSLMHSSDSDFSMNVSSPTAFSYIMLSDNDDEEDENKMCYRGNTIGWCPRLDQNPGTDPTRGVYNPLESFTEYKNGYYHAHLVYDFATSQGNGDIKSIWWNISVYGSDDLKFKTEVPYRRMLITARNRPSKLNENKYIFRTANNVMYAGSGYSDSDNYKLIENYDKWIKGIEKIKLSKEDTLFEKIRRKSAGRSFTYQGKTVYCDVNEEISMKDAYQPAKSIKDLSLEFKRIKADTEEVEATYTFKFDESFPDINECINNYLKKTSSGTLKFSVRPLGSVRPNGEFRGFLYIENYNSYYTYPTYNDGVITPNKSYSLNILFSIDMKTGEWIIKPGLQAENFKNVSFYQNMRYAYDRLDLYGLELYSMQANDSSYIFSTKNKGSLWRYNKNYLRFNGTGTEYTYYYSFDKNGYIVAKNSDNYDCFYKVIPSACAHSKLPETVTKTNTDTMKIQYDYYIQMPNLIPDEKGNYIPEAAPIM